MVTSPDVDSTTAQLLAAGAATLGESGARTVGPAVHAAWSGASVAGPAYTAECPAGDNLASHAAVARAPRGSVLVVSTGADTGHGGWGEILATGAIAQGIRGLVTDGGVRDVEALRRIGFPTFAGAVALAGTTKHGGGSTGRPVQLGGVSVAPGDWIVGDADGVVVIPGAELDNVLSAAHQRTEREADYLARLRNGATTVELLGLIDDIASVPSS